MKKTGTDRMKISASYICNVRLVSKIYEDPRKLNSKKLNNTIRAWAKDMKKHIQMVNKQMKKCPMY